MKTIHLFLLAAFWIPLSLSAQGVYQGISGADGYLSINGADNIFGISASTRGQDASIYISGKPDALNGDARLWLNRSYSEMSATVNFDLLRPTLTLIARPANQWGLGLEGNTDFVLFRKFQTTVGGPFTTQRIIGVDVDNPYTVVIGNGTTGTPKPILAVEDYIGSAGNGIARFRDLGASQVVIFDANQTYQMIVYGDALATGNWNTSDKKLKRQIDPLAVSIEQIRQLRPRRYQFRRDKQFQHFGLPEELQFGLIAQELEEVYPNLVRTTEVLNEVSGETESVKAINYTGLIPVLIAGMQELTDQLGEQQELIEESARERVRLQAQLAELRTQVDRLLAAETDRKAELENSHRLQLEQRAMLSQNAPNPFRQRTMVHYVVPADVGDAEIRVSSAAGTVLGTFAIPEAGEGTLTIEAATYPPGTYYYALVLDGKVVETRSMVLTR